MTPDAWLTLAVLAVMVGVLVRDVTAPSVAVIGAVVALLVAGVVTPAQAFVGLSNAAPITVAALYVLARAVEKTGAIQPLVVAALGDGRNRRTALARLLVPTAAASSVLNNTPIMAMLVPQVSNWAHRTGQSPSRYLMPLSFAAILGGVVTLIGTSTNLVVSGLLTEAGEPPLSMFELTPVGLPIAVAGVSIVLLLAWVLPDRSPARADLSEEFREFVVRMMVEAGGGAGWPISGGGASAQSRRSVPGGGGARRRDDCPGQPAGGAQGRRSVDVRRTGRCRRRSACHPWSGIGRAKARCRVRHRAPYVLRGGAGAGVAAGRMFVEEHRVSQPVSGGCRRDTSRRASDRCQAGRHQSAAGRYLAVAVRLRVSGPLAGS